MDLNHEASYRCGFLFVLSCCFFFSSSSGLSAPEVASCFDAHHDVNSGIHSDHSGPRAGFFVNQSRFGSLGRVLSDSEVNNICMLLSDDPALFDHCFWVVSFWWASNQSVTHSDPRVEDSDLFGLLVFFSRSSSSRPLSPFFGWEIRFPY